MTGQDFQTKLDAVVRDLQTKGKGRAVQIMLRGANNTPTVFPLSSDSSGVVNDSQLDPIQDFIDAMKPVADSFETTRAPVMAANDAFKTAQAPHQTLIDAAKDSRDALSVALDADPAYQTAKTALDAARADADYINSVAAYQDSNVSENFGNLSDAKGKYVG